MFTNFIYFGVVTLANLVLPAVLPKSITQYIPSKLYPIVFLFFFTNIVAYVSMAICSLFVFWHDYDLADKIPFEVIDHHIAETGVSSPIVITGATSVLIA